MSKKFLSSEGHRIHRQSLPETLADSLRERILNGELKEGEPLVQEAIATEYGVSRMPVREAFRQLEAAGLIATRIHKGAVVTGIPAEQIDELFELRALLECQLLEAAMKGMSKVHLSASAEILPLLEEAYLSQNVSRWGALNWEFHRSLYLPANLVQTLAVVQNINLQTDRYIRLQLVLSEAVTAAAQEHRELLCLCAEGDADSAVTYLRKHILDAGENLKFALTCKQLRRAV
jgi:DNA-binding GntR family transcriptional regulator